MPPSSSPATIDVRLGPGPSYGLCQIFLYPQDALLPDLYSPLMDTGGVFRCPEILLSPERCDEVSCDYTGHHPGLRGRFGRVREGQACLFYWWESDSSPRCPLYQSMEEGQKEGVPQHLFRQAEGIPYTGGDP